MHDIKCVRIQTFSVQQAKRRKNWWTIAVIKTDGIVVIYEHYQNICRWDCPNFVYINVKYEKTATTKWCQIFSLTHKWWRFTEMPKVLDIILNLYEFLMEYHFYNKAFKSHTFFSPDIVYKRQQNGKISGEKERDWMLDITFCPFVLFVCLLIA